MKPLKLMESLRDISDRIDRAGDILLGLDFDGTLAPIQPRPEDVVLAPPIRALLDRLAGSARVTTMIVSGRAMRDVIGLVGLPGLIYAGNHGLEIEGPGIAFVEPTAAATADRLETVTAHLRTRLANVPGVLVEPKGLTASVHYRNVPDEYQDELAGVVREAASADPDRFVLTSGHKVWEIRPRVTWNKGQALAWTIRQLGETGDRLVFYLGDDRTDEDAFAALPDGITVKVGSPETPTRARYTLPDPDSVHAFLGWLANRLAV
jgi:trehalose 6-phosphate phosphatase